MLKQPTMSIADASGGSNPTIAKDAPEPISGTGSNLNGNGGIWKEEQMTKRPTIKTLRELAQVASDDGFDGPLEALDYAEINANETEGITDEDHWEQVAYDSICWTSPFQEDANVRAWYESQGYRW